MEIASFIYDYSVGVGPGSDSRDPVLLDIDFSAVIAANLNSPLILQAVLISGVRHNVNGANEITESFAARLIGDFNSNGLVIVTITSPRAGDSIAGFQGIAFSNNSPFYSDANIADIRIPPTFQLEFIPSNRAGSVPSDQLTIFFSIVYHIGSES